MGTRNLTVAITKEGDLKVAQYGQWDGYPSGQGLTVLKFLQECDLEQFNEKLNNLEFYTEEEIDTEEFNEDECLSRNLAAEILNVIYYEEYSKHDVWTNKDYKVQLTAKKLFNRIEFAGDSLFCEWCYVIDLSKKVLEVYKGFNKEKLTEEDRFSYLEGRHDYEPVKIISSFNLDDLPSREEFLNILEPKETEEE